MHTTFPLNLAAISESELQFAAIVGAGVLAFTFIHSWRKVAETRAREQTKREIAAYVAEGTVKAEDAQKLMGPASEETEKQIANAVAWGTIKPEKAEALLRALRNSPAPRATPNG